MANKLVNGRWLQNKHARLMVTTRLTADEISVRITYPLRSLTLTNFSSAEGSLFLERKTEISPHDQIGEKISNELGGLPLALEHAGSFIKVTKCSYEVYFEKLRLKKLEIVEKGKAIKPNEEVLSKNQQLRPFIWSGWRVIVIQLVMRCKFWPFFHPQAFTGVSLTRDVHA